MCVFRMGDSISVDVILEFLKRNKFTKAEAALRGELGNRLDDKELGKEINGGVVVAGEEDTNIKSTRHGADPSIVEASKVLIGKVGENIAVNEKNFVFSNGLDNTVLDLYSWASNGVSGEKRITWPGCISTDLMHEKKSDQQKMPNITCSKDDLVGKLWSRSDVSDHPSSELRKECCVKTVVDKQKGKAVEKQEAKRKAEVDNVRSALKEQVDEVGRALFFGKNLEFNCYSRSDIAKKTHFQNESNKSGRVVKTMEKISHVWVVKNYSATKKLRVGQSIQSDIIRVPEIGDYSFRIDFYPQGQSENDYINDSMSVVIVNESRETVDVVCSVEILKSTIPLLARDDQPLKHSRFKDIIRYREVTRLTPQLGSKVHLYDRSTLRDGCYVSFRDSIKIKVIIGVFRDQPLAMVPQPFDPFVIIEVREWHTTRFYVEESVLKAQCPQLLPQNSITTQDIVVQGIDMLTFRAVLWYMKHQKLQRRDEDAILKSNPRDPNSIGRKMLAAARQLKLGHLIRLIEALFRCGDTFLIDFGIFGDIYRALRKCGAKANEVKVKQKVIKTESSVTRA